MNYFKIAIACSLSLILFGCASVEVQQKEENLFVLKSWGSKDKTLEQLKVKVQNKAKELCAPNKYEFVGSGSFDKKIAGLSQAIGGFATYDPSNITHTYTRHVRCIPN